MELIEIARKYFPGVRIEFTGTKNDPQARERYFLTKRNKGSFSKEGMAYRIRQEKIEKIIYELSGDIKNLNHSKTSNSAYFEYQGLQMRVSDHRSHQEFFGFDYLIKTETDENRIIQRIKGLIPNEIKLI